MRLLQVVGLGIAMVACGGVDPPAAGAGASSGATSSSSTGAANACVPGAQAACACPGGGDGAQVCLDDGSGYGPCAGCGAGGAGSGGTGATGGDAGAGGVAPPECVVPADCPGVDNECRSRTCEAGSCGASFVASGTPVAAQSSGDCAVVACDGAGSTTSVYDAGDLVSDGNACTVDACTMQGPTYNEIGSAPSCGGTCVPSDPGWGIGTHVFCSGVAIQEDGGPEFLGILWIDDKGNDIDSDDEWHKCGDFSQALGCGCSSYTPTGYCPPGKSCDIVRRYPDGSTEYVGGHCE